MWQFLEGYDAAALPFEWWLSRICEEFNCLPSAALREWQSAPVGLLETIIEFRAFATAKSAVDRAKSQKDIPDTPMCKLVQRIEFAVVKAELEERQHQCLAD